jgi:hypothetical protein
MYHSDSRRQGHTTLLTSPFAMADSVKVNNWSSIPNPSITLCSWVTSDEDTVIRN